MHVSVNNFDSVQADAGNLEKDLEAVIGFIKRAFGSVQLDESFPSINRAHLQARALRRRR